MKRKLSTAMFWLLLGTVCLALGPDFPPSPRASRYLLQDLTIPRTEIWPEWGKPFCG
jgi:hypothetical protein